MDMIDSMGVVGGNSYLDLVGWAVCPRRCSGRTQILRSKQILRKGTG